MLTVVRWPVKSATYRAWKPGWDPVWFCSSAAHITSEDTEREFGVTREAQKRTAWGVKPGDGDP
jgi:hypothetical protein